MATRMELELTSARPDGSWTWRAAGARQPKGVLDGNILYAGAKVGDVVRAEADVQIDGITILSVTAPKQKAGITDRLEIVGSGRDSGPGVTTSLVPKGGRRPGGPDRDRPRRDGPSGRDGGDRRRDDRDRPRRDRDGAPRDRDREGAGAGGDQAGRRPVRDRPAGGRPGREGGTGERAPGRPRAGERPPRGEGPRPGRPAPRSEGAPERPAPKRLTPGTKHRDAVLADLSPEQRPVAEQVLRGGIPAVRQAIAAENAKAQAEGRPAVAGEPLLAMAEELLPRLKAASWRDRAEAVVPIIDEVSIRDLRSVVAGADAGARDDETRMLASSVREALERRLEAQRTSWVTEITTNLEEGRVVRALRLSARPPDPGVRFPADLALRLAEAAGAALAPDAPADRWAAVLDAVAASPVRRNVRPAGLPEGAPEELLATARQAAGRVPALAPLLGLPMPPPPGPARPTSPGRMARPPAPRHGPRPPARPVPAPPAPAPPPAPVEATPSSSPVSTPPAPLAEGPVSAPAEPTAPTAEPEPPSDDAQPPSHDAQPTAGAQPMVEAQPTTGAVPPVESVAPVESVPPADAGPDSGETEPVASEEAVQRAD